MFRYDSGLSQLLRKVYACLLINGLWLLCCLPVVTAGAATAGMCYAVEKYVLREESYPIAAFFKAFRRDFGQATLCWLLFLAAGAFLCWDFSYFWGLLEDGNAEGTLCVVIAVLLVLLVLTAVYAFFYLSRFEDRLGRVLKNALLLMLPHPLVNLRILALCVLLALCLVYQPYFLLFLPVVSCWLICLSMDKLFGKIVPSSVYQEDVPDTDEIEEAPDNA